ncbi:MAG: hypothetical protein V3T23_08510 [Nitrososphaerales archaeon]
MADKNGQMPGGDANPLQNNFTGSSGSVQSKTGNSTAPKISGSGGGNATGPELSHQRGQQQRG